jgi:hypothetical protein
MEITGEMLNITVERKLDFVPNLEIVPRNEIWHEDEYLCLL